MKRKKDKSKRGKRKGEREGRGKGRREGGRKGSYPTFFGCCSVAQSRPTLCDPMDCSQASLSFTISWVLLKLMSIELVMPSNIHHPIKIEIGAPLMAQW